MCRRLGIFMPAKRDAIPGTSRIAAKFMEYMSRGTQPLAVVAQTAVVSTPQPELPENQEVFPWQAYELPPETRRTRCQSSPQKSHMKKPR
ncbi:MAG: hypothetical protein Q7S10_03800 [bacterium]|nr:hypothetical protein [bacterium]